MERVAEDQASLSPLQTPPLPGPGQSSTWHGLYGAARPLAIAACANAHTGGPVLVIVADSAALVRTEQALRFFAPELPVLVLPDWETLPYDRFSPYQDIISDRISTLSRLPHLDAGLVLVSVHTAMHRFAPRKWLAGQSFNLVTGETLDREGFRLQLEHAG